MGNRRASYRLSKFKSHFYFTSFKDYMSKTYNLTFCVWLYSLIIVCLMRLYEKLGGYFVRNTMRDYRLALFFHTIVAVLLFSAIIYVSIKWPLRHSLKSGTVLLLGLVIIFMMLTLLRTQKNQVNSYVFFNAFLVHSIRSKSD